MFPATDITALFLAVYDAPKDLARRQVLADALMEAGDPRGEFITLQLDGSSRSRKRAQKLLDRHERDWLAPLRLALRVVKSNQLNLPRHRLGHTEWRDGFLVSADVWLTGNLVNEPAWATVESLVVHGVMQREPTELASPWMRSLEKVQLGFEPTDRERYAWEDFTQTVDRVRELLVAAHRPHALRRGQEWCTRSRC